MSANLYSLFSERFRKRLTHACIETDTGQRYCYGDLEQASARYARFLTGLGLEPGDRVAAQTEKTPQALFFYLGCLRANLVYLPINTAYRQAEIEYFLDDAEPRFVLCNPGTLEAVRALAGAHGIEHVFTLDAHGRGTLPDASTGLTPEFATVAARADDVAVILYTSGTTGKPKGAMLTHGNLVSNAQTLHQAWGWRADDVLLHALPLFHIHGLFVACHCALLGASTMLFLSKFDADTVVRLLPRATVFMGVPTFYTRLLALPDFGRETCRRVRLFTSGSAPLLAQTFEEFEARTGHRILERYGMTETGMNTSNPLDGPRRPGTVGPPLPGVSIRIAADDGRDLPAGETGQLLVKGPNVFKGYWRQPAKTGEDFAADGWFRTGDLARRDADGYVAIVGRAKDLIISGGLNVYPKEIETYIDEIDGVAESAVIGLPHPDFGEAVTAIVVRAAAAVDLTEEAILRTLKQRIAGYKVPKRVFFSAELPRNTMGKVQKNVLRERYRAPARG